MVMVCWLQAIWKRSAATADDQGTMTYFKSVSRIVFTSSRTSISSSLWYKSSSIEVSQKKRPSCTNFYNPLFSLKSPDSKGVTEGKKVQRTKKGHKNKIKRMILLIDNRSRYLCFKARNNFRAKSPIAKRPEYISVLPELCQFIIEWKLAYKLLSKPNSHLIFLNFPLYIQKRHL
jgi:hypothetical protein